MINPPFIEVTFNPDSSITYTTRLTSLGTNMYGIVLATMADYVARMMEAEGGFKAADIKADIVKHFLQEIKEPTNTHAVNQLQ